MNDKELADAVVALGVLTETEDGGYYYLPETSRMHSTEVVRDWRVAGALMEKCVGLTVAELEVDSGYGRGWEVYNAFAPGTNTTGGQDYKYTKAANDSLPRAIIEAYVEALNIGDDEK